MSSRNFSSLSEFVAYVDDLAAGVELPFAAAAERVSDVLHERAMKVFGDNLKLAPLAESTQQERAALCYAADEPLVRDGQLLRDRVEREHTATSGAIGSSEVVRAYHELGYNAPKSVPVPARPVFKTALDESHADVEALLGESTGAALGFVEIGEVR